MVSSSHTDPPGKVLKDSELFIGGTWSAAAPPAGWIDSIDPATGAVGARVGEPDEVDVSNAVAAARRAFESPPWGDCAPGEREKSFSASAA